MGKLLRPGDVANLLDVHPATVRHWLAIGLLPSIKTPGGQYRIHPTSVEHLRRAIEGQPPKQEPNAA